MTSMRAIVAALLFVVGLGGCASDTRPLCEDQATTALRIAVGNASSPVLPARDVTSARFLTDLPLVRVDDTGRPLPGLAEQWTSPDRRTWTFTLWDGLRTHGGAPLTAELIRADLLAKRPALAALDPVARDIVSIDAPAPRTLVIRLARPVSGALFESLATIEPSAAGRTPAHEAGPYRRAAESAEQIDLEAFPAFAGAAPALRHVQLRYYPSTREAWMAFLRHEADMLYDVPPDGATRLAAQPDVTLYHGSRHRQYVLGFQQVSPRLRDPRVRRAINLAIDRDEIVRRVFAGHTEATHGPFSRDYWAVDGAAPTWRFDPIAARAQLEAARGRGAAPLEIECLTSNQLPLVANVAAALEAQLAKINVRLKLVPLPIDQFYRRLADGDYESFVMLMANGTSSVWPYVFWRSGQSKGPLRPHYTAADAALDALYSARSDMEEISAARRVLDIMREDPPAAFLVTASSIRAVRRRWQMPADDPRRRDIRESIPRWRLATADCRAS